MVEDPDEAEEAVNSESSETAESEHPVDDADALPWAEDTGQKEAPSDKTAGKDTPADKAETQSAVTITKDDITAVIVAKIKKKRDNNEKIGQLLKPTVWPSCLTCLQRSTKHFWQMSPRFKGGHHAGSTCNPFCFQLEEVAELYAICKAGAELSK